MNRTKISYYFVFITIFTFITLTLFIIQKSFFKLTAPINQIKESKITPLDTNIDLDVITDIENRQEIDPNATVNIVSNVVNPASPSSTINP